MGTRFEVDVGVPLKFGSALKLHTLLERQGSSISSGAGFGFVDMQYAVKTEKEGEKLVERIKRALKEAKIPTEDEVESGAYTSLCAFDEETGEQVDV